MSLKSNIFLLALLVMLITAGSGFFYIRAQGGMALQRAHLKAENEAQRIAGLIEAKIKEQQQTVMALSHLDEVQDSLMSPKQRKIDDVHRIFDHFKEATGKNDIYYLMNREGVVVASTLREGEASLMGHNYSFRPYFHRALGGKPTVYFALGVTTNVRGVYLSTPVYDLL